MFVLNRLLDQQTDAALKKVHTIQQNLLLKLRTDYAQELKPNHRPHWYDPHKKRHAKKVAMAKKLEAALQGKMTSLHDIEAFVLLFREFRKTNAEIDVKGGRFGRILHSQEFEIDNLYVDVLQIYSIKETAHNGYEKIIRHLMCLQKETLIEKTEFLNGYDPATIKKAYDYHYRQLKNIKDRLLQLYVQAKEGLPKQQVSDEVALQEIEQLMTNLQLKLDLIERNVTHVAITVQETETNTARKIYQAKIQFLRELLTTHQQQQLSAEISRANQQAAIQKLPANEKAKYFLLKMLLQHFVEDLRFEQKNLFWRFILSKFNNRKKKTYLSGTSLMTQKEWWYKGCYAGLKDQELSGICKEEIRDPFKLDDLSRELKAIAIENMSSAELMNEINQVQTSYLNEGLNLEKDKHQTCKHLVFREWKINVAEAFDHFKNELSFMAAAVDAVFSRQKMKANNEEEKQIFKLVQCARDKVSANFPKLKNNQSPYASYSAPQLSGNQFFKPKQILEQTNNCSKKPQAAQSSTLTRKATL